MAEKVVVDQDECIGCGACVSIAPETFKIDSSGKAVAYSQDRESEDKIEEAMDACPVSCIHYE